MARVREAAGSAICEHHPEASIRLGGTYVDIHRTNAGLPARGLDTIITLMQSLTSDRLEVDRSAQLFSIGPTFTGSGFLIGRISGQLPRDVGGEVIAASDNTSFTTAIIPTTQSVPELGLSSYGAQTRWDLLPFGAIILVDITRCGGAGYSTIGTDRQPLDLPLDVLLFHELGHVFLHTGLGRTPVFNNAEEQAVIDLENRYRSQKGLRQRSRNPSDFGPSSLNCNGSNPAQQPPSPSTPESSTCALRELLEDQRAVELVRTVRDEVVLSTPWGRRHFPEVDRIYRNLSPGFVHRARRSPAVMTAMNGVVAPALRLFAQLTLGVIDGGEATWRARKLLTAPRRAIAGERSAGSPVSATVVGE